MSDQSRELMSIKEDQLRAAADGGVYWFTEWNGGVVVFGTLEEAERAAFEDCVVVLHETNHGKDGKLSGISLTIFKGREPEAQVKVELFGMSPRFAWSPPDSDFCISPEEYAHLIHRRSRR
jgi:hypothetical protein